MQAYSLDLRRTIVHALDRGLLPAQVAATFGLGVSTVTRCRHQWRASGDLTPKPIPGDTPRIGPDQSSALRAQVARLPDATLVEHCAAWEAATGVRVSSATMSRPLTKLCLPLKKTGAAKLTGTGPGWRSEGQLLERGERVGDDWVDAVEVAVADRTQSWRPGTPPTTPSAPARLSATSPRSSSSPPGIGTRRVVRSCRTGTLVGPVGCSGQGPPQAAGARCADRGRGGRDGWT